MKKTKMITLRITQDELINLKYDFQQLMRERKFLQKDKRGIKTFSDYLRMLLKRGWQR